MFVAEVQGGPEKVPCPNDHIAEKAWNWFQYHFMVLWLNKSYVMISARQLITVTTKCNFPRQTQLEKQLCNENFG